jgi:long-subunit acyl-CoA synthetase (AMP-forming)
VNILREAIARVPAGRPALGDGERDLTYGELAEAVDGERHWLESHGVTRCALQAANGCGWAIADLAMLELGATNLPLPAFFTPAQQRHALDDSGMESVLTDNVDAFSSLFPEFTPAGRSPCSGLVLLKRQPRAFNCPAGIAKITYTSGSTADPRGVALRAETLMAVSASLADAVASAGVARHLCLLPLATLLENLTAVYVPLLLGASTCLPPAGRTGVRHGSIDAQTLLQCIAGSGAHSLVLVPELLRALVSLRRAGGAQAAAALGQLRFIAVGGAPVSALLLEEAKSMGLPVFEGYGLSECGSVVCLNTPAARRLGSVGRPLPHLRLRVDAQGEIHVGGLPGEPEGCEIATGDLGHIDADGFVFIHGRRRNCFITSYGRNITPEWVERELQQEPEFAGALAFGESRPWVSALLWTRNPDCGEDAVGAAVARANARLPDYAQVRAWTIAPRGGTDFDELRTANGRLRRDAALVRHGTRLEALYSQDIRGQACA